MREVFGAKHVRPKQKQQSVYEDVNTTPKSQWQSHLSASKAASPMRATASSQPLNSKDP
jgi:hypothetical protein